MMLKLVECAHILDRAARGKAESKQERRAGGAKALFRRRSAMATGELSGDEEAAIRAELEARTDIRTDIRGRPARSPSASLRCCALP